ncbi:MAG: glycosyltransferase family 2 protein [Ruminococcus sp.]
MDNPKISVIISIYNGEKDMHIMLDSLAAQPFQDIEYILIDNGSTDRTREVCKRYSDNDSRFRIEVIEKNIGYIGARNYGLKKAKGEYITFADADDFLSENAYGIMYRAVSKSDADMLIAPYNIVYPDGNVKFMSLNFETGTYNKEKITKQILPSIFGYNKDHIIIHGFMWRMLFRKSIVDASNNTFYEEAKPKEDQLFNQVHTVNCNAIEIIDYPVYNYRINPASVTAKLVSDFNYEQTWKNSVFMVDKSVENAENAHIAELVEHSIYTNFYSSLYTIIINTCKSVGFKEIKNTAKRFNSLFEEKIIGKMYDTMKDDNLSFHNKFILKLVKRRKFSLLLFSIKAIQKVRGGE